MFLVHVLDQESEKRHPRMFRWLQVEEKERKALQCRGDHLKYSWAQQNPGEGGAQLAKE